MIHETYYNRYRGWGTGTKPDGIVVDVRRSAGSVLAPSHGLLRDWQNRRRGGMEWSEFRKRFLHEMGAPDAQSEIERLRGLAADYDVWLVCSCWNDRGECHRFVVKELIEAR